MSGAVEWVVLRQVDTDTAFRAPIKKLFDRIVNEAWREVIQPGRAPKDTGALVDSLAPGAGVTGVYGDPASGEIVGAVGTNIEVYPSVLENSLDYHYAHGPSLGEQTAGWLDKTLDMESTVIGDALKECADAIGVAWHG